MRLPGNYRVSLPEDQIQRDPDWYFEESEGQGIDCEDLKLETKKTKCQSFESDLVPSRKGKNKTDCQKERFWVIAWVFSLSHSQKSEGLTTLKTILDLYCIFCEFNSYVMEKRRIGRCQTGGWRHIRSSNVIQYFVHWAHSPNFIEPSHQQSVNPVCPISQSLPDLPYPSKRVLINLSNLFDKYNRLRSDLK